MGADTGSRRARRKQTILVGSLLFVLALTAVPSVFFYYDQKPAAAAEAGDGWLPPPVPHLAAGALLRTRRQFSSYQEYLQLQLKKTTNARLRKLWTSRDWRRKVDVFAAVFVRLMRDEGLLWPGAKAMCIGARVGQEVLALKENGVEDAVGIDLVPAPPLVTKGDIHRHPFPNDTFDFEFSNVFDHALFPSLFVSEIERTLKPGGVAVLHLTLNRPGDSYSANDLLSLDPLVQLFERSEVVDVRQVDVFGLDTELVMRKRQQQQPKCTPKWEQHTIRLAEALIVQEPSKPWITLKQNVKRIKYLPTLVDIGNRSRYVYVDVGARTYVSSIGSWFNKVYPKQGHNFTIFAIEADKAFHAGYAKRKDVTLLPYAAWSKNESLLFGTHGDAMGRILEQTVRKNSVEVVQGFDFAWWLTQTVRSSDYVVMKMDVEGTEFDLLPRLMETGGICLIDELFLECHYNRWQKCCPQRTSKYNRTYMQCLALFQALRSRGVLVHQWW